MTEAELAQLDPFNPPPTPPANAGRGIERASRLRHAITQHLQQLDQVCKKADVSGGLDWRIRYAADRHLWRLHYRSCYELLWDFNLALIIVDDAVWQCIYVDSIPWALRPFYWPPRTISERLLHATGLLDLIVEFRAGKRQGFMGKLNERRGSAGFLLSRRFGLRPDDDIALFAHFAAVYDFFYADQPVL